MRGGGRGTDGDLASGGWAERGRGFEGWLLVECGLDDIKREKRKGDLPRSLGLVQELRSGKTDERSGCLRRVVQNMLLLLLLFRSPYQSRQELIRCLSREKGVSQEVGAEMEVMRCVALLSELGIIWNNASDA